MSISVERFSDFFAELWGHEPFPWQERLARQVCGGTWPEVIDLPTASGKTACLDVAVFALAAQAGRSPAERSIGRRVFFVVNRRVIVDEAHQRAVTMASRLHGAEAGTVLRAVADALQVIGGDPDSPPLDVAILRGGLYRDNRWSRSITQPTIITSTIDQVGSRLLFRGYGVSEAARPTHSTLVAHDSLILLDEAHISRPFVQTVQAVQRYRGRIWAVEPVSTPCDVVQMSATPGVDPESTFRLEAPDRKHSVLAARLNALKPARLLRAKKAKGSKALTELAKVMVKEAIALQSDERKTAAVIVNRVAAARAVYQILREKLGEEAEVYLALGRMRPLDRDDLTAAIQARVGKPRKEAADEKPFFVVATQCLEVGADFDFDVLVTECASLDALRQRFGRLNRTGRPIDARGAIIIREDQKTETEDPIYGSALSSTWAWLESIARDGAVDFGMSAMEEALEGVEFETLLAPSVDAPVMFPAYVDIWTQTSPSPAPEPDVALFLHGPERGEPDVQVCWRSDLPAKFEEDLCTAAIGLCPPSSPECMTVPIGLVRTWLGGGDPVDESRGDILEAEAPEPAEPDAAADRAAVAWRGLTGSRLIRFPGEVSPGDTLVLPVAAGGWDRFGHIPRSSDSRDESEGIDVAERAFRQSRGKPVLRLTPERLALWPETEALGELRGWVDDPETDLSVSSLRDVLLRVAATLPDESSDADSLRLLAGRHGLVFERYPEPLEGVVLTTRRRTDAGPWFIPAMDEGEDETSSTGRRERISLRDHTSHLLATVDELVSLLPVQAWRAALRAAAQCHDLGKADERFQALLLSGDLADAWAQPAIWAKSDKVPLTPAQRARARRRSRLPEGFRHEMLSMQLAERTGLLPEDGILCDLALHLVAAHHGRGRPFAPVVIDPDAPDVHLEEPRATLTAAERLAYPPHRLDSGIAERFWVLTRRFGWWGLAYLEAVLRLADQLTSRREEKGGPVAGEAATELEEARQ